MCVRKQYPISESLLTSLLTFFVFSIRLNPWKLRLMYESNFKNSKELVNLSNLSNFQLALYKHYQRTVKQSKTTNLLCGKTYELRILCRISRFSTRISLKLVETNFKNWQLSTHALSFFTLSAAEVRGAQKIKLDSFHPPPPFPISSKLQSLSFFF